MENVFGVLLILQLIRQSIRRMHAQHVNRLTAGTKHSHRKDFIIREVKSTRFLLILIHTSTVVIITDTNIGMMYQKKTKSLKLYSILT